MKLFARSKDGKEESVSPNEQTEPTVFLAGEQIPCRDPRTGMFPSGFSVFRPGDGSREIAHYSIYPGVDIRKIAYHSKR